MATTPTANYGWLIPVPGTEIDTWGPIVNTVFDDIDAEMFLKANLAGATFTGAIELPAGTVSLPSLGIGAVDTGFYEIAANRIGLAIAGANLIDFIANQVLINGSAPFLIVRGDGGQSNFRSERFQNAAAGPLFSGRKARGTFAVPLVIVDGDTIVRLAGQGHDGTNFADWGAIEIDAFEAVPSVTGHGAKFRVDLCPPGSITPSTNILSFEATNGLRFSGVTVFGFNRHLRLRSYTVATLPSSAVATEMIYVSDEVGGAIPAFSDGTNWRRVTDRQIVS